MEQRSSCVSATMSKSASRRISAWMEEGRRKEKADINTSAVWKQVSILLLNGVNDFGTPGYKGPCPPSGTHRYVFRLFALDTRLALPEGMRKEDVLAKLKGHVVATAELGGTYTRRHKT